MIPPWLSHANPPTSLCAEDLHRTATFLEKTMKGAAAFTAGSVLCGDYANHDGFLQKIDPLFKLPAILACILAVSLIRSPWTAAVFLLIAIVSAFFSAIAPLFFIRRVYPFVLLFGVLPALPALCNVITPGDPVLVLADFGHTRHLGHFTLPAVLTVTRQGLHGASLFAGRVAASISLAILLPLTTRWDVLLRGFAALRVPQLFIMIMEMSYRYIALLVQTVADLHEARKSRTVRYLPMVDEQRWVASRMGFLFIKSCGLSREVHDAMLARGFSGEVRLLALQKTGGRDICFLLLALLTCAALVLADRSGW